MRLSSLPNKPASSNFKPYWFVFLVLTGLCLDNEVKACELSFCACVAFTGRESGKNPSTTMDSYEVTRLIFAKIKNLDPENASKIMGYILIQDLGVKDLVRLAYGPDTLLHSLILRAKIQLGLCSSTSSTPSTPSSPSPLNPIARPNSSNSSNPFSQSSPRLPNGFEVSRNPSSPSSNSWPVSGFANSPKSSPLLSFDNIRTGSFPVFSNHHKNGGDVAAGSDIIDEHQLNEYLSFLNESSSSARVEDLVDPRAELGHGAHDWAHTVNNGDAHFHRRSYSASDACFGSEEAGLGTGFKPCLYFARGFCKNGSNCKFVHGGFVDAVDASGAVVGSPSNPDGFEQHEEIMRLKAAQQQRLAAASQFMNGVSPSPYNKYMNFLLQQQQNDPQRWKNYFLFLCSLAFGLVVDVVSLLMFPPSCCRCFQL